MKYTSERKYRDFSIKEETISKPNNIVKKVFSKISNFLKK
jgi:hypothetical protein